MPSIRAIVLDLYGTLIDIHTQEWKDEVWNRLSLFMQYYGAQTDAGRLRHDFRSGIEQNLKGSQERYPEVELENIFADILAGYGLDQPFLPEACCKLFRVMSRERFGLFPEVLPVLGKMKSSGYPMALVSNAQRVFSAIEMRILGLHEFFLHSFFSSDIGFQKPDPRLFSLACSALGVEPAAAVYIGDNPQNDIPGAKLTGMPVIILNRQGDLRHLNTAPDALVNDLRQAWEWILKA